MDTSYWWNSSDDPAKIEQWGGEPAPYLSDDELGRLIAGEILSLTNRGVDPVEPERSEPAPEVKKPAVKRQKNPKKAAAGEVSPKTKNGIDVFLSVSGASPLPELEQDYFFVGGEFSWLTSSFQKAWVLARRDLSKAKAELKDLERRMENARVHAINSVFPGSEYDPGDIRIDEEEGRLTDLWLGKAEVTAHRIQQLEEEFAQLDSERSLKIDSIHRERWMNSFGWLFPEPCVLPQCYVLVLRASSASFLEVKNKAGQWVPFSRDEMNNLFTPMSSILGQGTSGYTLNVSDWSKVSSRWHYEDSLISILQGPTATSWACYQYVNEHAARGQQVELCCWPEVVWGWKDAVLTAAYHALLAMTIP